MKANRLWGGLKVETNETGQLAIALCHIRVCFMQNKNFTYISGTFFLLKKYKAAAVILISKKQIPNPIQISAKSEKSKTEISTMKQSKKWIERYFFLPDPPFWRKLEVGGWRGLALLWQRFPFHSFSHLWIKQQFLKKGEAKNISSDKHTGNANPFQHFCQGL